MSITMGTTLASLVTNKRRVSALKSLGIVTVGDALTYYPFRVTEPVPASRHPRGRTRPADGICRRDTRHARGADERSPRLPTRSDGR